MAGKLTTALTKKEAEAYRSQGLHKEALTLYQNLLSSSPNLEAGFKDAIKSQIQRIQVELEQTPPQEYQRLTLAEILRIRKGWGSEASESDLLVCAQAFCNIEHYKYALAEVIHLIRRGCTPDKVIGLAITCLVHLQTAKQIPNAVERLSRKLFRQPEQALLFVVLLAEEAVNFKYTAHAAALYRLLQKDPRSKTDLQPRLVAIARGIRSLRAARKTDDASQAERRAERPAKAAEIGSRPRWLSLLKKYFTKSSRN